MTRVTVDAGTLAKLQGLNDLLEICDESGQTLGYFHPFMPLPRDQAGRVISPVSDEEMARRRSHREGRPLKDILENLQTQ